jgi:hypothetical protein
VYQCRKRGGVAEDGDEMTQRRSASSLSFIERKQTLLGLRCRTVGGGDRLGIGFCHHGCGPGKRRSRGRVAHPVRQVDPRAQSMPSPAAG